MTDHGGLLTAVASYEQACLDAQVAITRVAGEAALSAFAARGDMVDLALAVVQSTSVPVARYHACSALRAAALDRWESFSPELRYGAHNALRCTLFKLACTPVLEAFERAALLQTAALLIHRAYLEEGRESRSAFIRDLCSVSSRAGAGGPHDAVEAATGLKLLSFVVDVFANVATGTHAAQLDRERGTRSFAEFCAAGGDLYVVYNTGCTAVSNIYSENSKRVSSVDSLAPLAFGVVAAILSFPSAPHESMAASSSEFVVHRGPEWGDILGSFPALASRLFLAYDELSGSEGETRACGMQSIRDALNHVASVSGKSYSPLPGLGNAVLVSLLHGLEGRAWAFAKSRSEFMMYAELWRRIHVAHGLDGLLAVGGWDALQSFAKNTILALRSKSLLRTSTDGDSLGQDGWTSECECLLLETWAGLAAQSESSGHLSSLEPLLAEVVLAHIDALLQTKLAGSRDSTAADVLPSVVDTEEDFGYDDESREEATFQAAAQLCRCSGSKPLTVLASIIAEVSGRSFLLCGGNFDLDERGVNILRAAQEDLVSMLKLSCAVLADDGTSEVPFIPSQFLAVLEGMQVATHPMSLLSAILQAAELESNTFFQRSQQGMKGAGLSPRVEATMLASLCRLARTYFVPIDDSHVLVQRFLGGHEVSKRARSLCLAKCTFTLKHRRYEPDPIQAAASLFLALAEARKSPFYADLRDNSLWDPLPTAGLAMFETFPGAAVEQFGLCLSYIHAEHVGERLVNPVLICLRNAGRGKYDTANAAEQALMSLQILCGVASCAPAAAYVERELSNSLHGPDGPVYIAVKEFSTTYPLVPMHCARLVKLLACMHLSSSPDTLATLVKDLIFIIQESVTALKRSAAHAMEDEDLASIFTGYVESLQQLVEFHPDATIGQGGFYAIGLIMSVMNESLFNFPGVRHRCFSLVNTLVLKFPQQVASLSSDLASAILSALMAEIRGYEEDGTRDGLEAVAALAEFRAQRRGMELSSGPSIGVLDRALEEFLCLILESVFNGNGEVVNFVDVATVALLPLALCGERSRHIFRDACRSFTGLHGGKQREASSIVDLIFTVVRDYDNLMETAEADQGDSARWGQKRVTGPQQLLRTRFGEYVRQLRALSRRSVGTRIEVGN
jgi:hypothetical protein